ncbi:galactose-1-epimerase [Chitinophaga caeni]|uniref:Aldose 1-epimerase n=2 Tax=Chitinophaga caeni TaxID=2029983 RepID=A0A291QQQ4_9BACT|nr:galactose-1-epimerase [Chitinophaga caeni]
MIRSSLFVAICSLVFLACQNSPSSKNTGTGMQDSLAPAYDSFMLDAKKFDTTIGGNPVALYFLRNSHGMKMAVTNYGAKVVSLLVPDKNGLPEDVVLGFDHIGGYFNAAEKYYGGVVGRFANRIGKSKFTMDGKTYHLYSNNGNNTLHGGKSGFNSVVWEVSQPDSSSLVFHYRSIDGEEGFPGNLDVTMVYTLTENNIFRIHYKAITDKPTQVNLSHHSFFNLHGAGNGSIEDHIVTINADKYTPIDDEFIPTGIIAPVKNTPMDFTNPTKISDALDSTFDQVRFGKGYDHNWVLNNQQGNLSLAATVYEPKSGRTMEVWTTEPGLQFYTGNFQTGADTGKLHKAYRFREAFCMETQHFPNTPNQPNFPSTRLEPGQTYTHTCEYRFSAK